MAGDEIPANIGGNLTADPELRFTPSGAAVANFTVASTPRVYDKQTGEWRDGTTTFTKCTVWRGLAENVAESLRKGMRVRVSGKYETKEWEDKETGQKRSRMEVLADDVGPSLQMATAQVTKIQRNNAQGGQQAAQPQSGGWDQQPSGNQQQDDPWASANANAASGAPAAADDPWAT